MTSTNSAAPRYKRFVVGIYLRLRSVSPPQLRVEQVVSVYIYGEDLKKINHTRHGQFSGNWILGEVATPDTSDRGC